MYVNNISVCVHVCALRQRGLLTCMALSERTVGMTYNASVKECLIIIQRKMRKTKKMSRKW